MSDSNALPSNWIGLIPAAGKGLRLGLPYPKELYPIIRDNHYKPVSQFVVENLLVAQVRHLVFVVNETKSQLLSYFGNGSRFGADFSYVIQEGDSSAAQSTSPGLASALDTAYHLTRGKTVFFGMPDTIMQPRDLYSLAWEARPAEEDVTLCVFPISRPEKGGMVRWDEQWRVVEIVDKPQHTDLTHTWGCIIWSPRFTEHLHHCHRVEHISDFAIILNRAIAEGMRVRAFAPAGGNYIDLGTYEEIMELDQRFRE